MARRPQRPPVAPASSGVPVQRPVGVPSSWLDDYESTDEAEELERLERLIADFDLVTSLALRGFEGPAYDYFAHVMARYGIAVIGGWMQRGLILARCRDRGFGGLPPTPLGAFDDPDVVEALAGETVAWALVHFRSDVLVPGRWDHRRGATLKTFFVGQCLIRFANVYRRWWKAEVERAGEDCADFASLESLERRQVPSVEDLVVEQAFVDATLRRIRDPRVRAALVLRGRGMSNADVAEHMGMTEKTVERMIANERDRMKRRGIA